MAKASLVEAVKNLQRSDPDCKQAWWEYCDQESQGVKDPNRHDEGSLKKFLSWFQADPEPTRPPQRQAVPRQAIPRQAVSMQQFGGFGKSGGKGLVPLAGMGQSSPSDLVGFIKSGQRESPNFKDGWQTYNAMYAGGVNDPSRHEPEYIVGFIDYLGQLVQADIAAEQQQAVFQQQQQQRQHLRMGPVGGGGNIGMARKRPMDVFGGGAGEPPRKKAAGASKGGGGGSDKATLVEQVKALQRRDDETKQAWWAFTDEHHGGVHDPNRHEQATLQEFLSMMG